MLYNVVQPRVVSQTQLYLVPGMVFRSLSDVRCSRRCSFCVSTLSGNKRNALFRYSCESQTDLNRNVPTNSTVRDAVGSILTPLAPQQSHMWVEITKITSSSSPKRDFGVLKGLLVFLVFAQQCFPENFGISRVFSHL